VVIQKQNLERIVYQSEQPIGIILGEYITGGLGAVRCLGRAGIPVVWVDSTSKHVGFHSKYCKGIVCPDLKSHASEYIDFLVEIGCKLNHKGVLFPIRDLEVMAILQHRSELENYYYIPMADLPISQILLNKYLFYKALNRYKIPHAQTYFLEEKTDVKIVGKKIHYPCILKPFHSARFVQEFGTKVFIAHSIDQLYNFYQKAVDRQHQVFAQEIIPGHAGNMCGMNAYYDKQFIPHGFFMYRRIREWPHGMGNGCFIESEHIPELEKILTPFIKKIGYYGIVDAEFRMDPRDNVFKLIEINSRCWMQSSLSARCGANIPYLAYLASIGKTLDRDVEIKRHLKWVFMGEDFRSAIKSVINHNLSLVDWIKSYRGTIEYSILAYDDLVPFFYSLIPYYHK
jgi:predicted ATP-grasp superfamily ATP-dependent carboligase